MFSEHVLDTGDAEGSEVSHHPFSLAPDLKVVKNVGEGNKQMVILHTMNRKESLEKENRNTTSGLNHIETNVLYIFQDRLK